MRSLLLLLPVAFLVLLCPGSLVRLAAQAVEPESERQQESASEEHSLARLRQHILESPRLLGDPWGLRSWLEQRGLTLDFYGNHQHGINARGGANTGGAQRHSGSLDYFARLDTRRMGLWDDGQFLLQAKTNRNENINPDVGALSAPIDDADFDESIYVDQLWYQHSFLGGAIQARGGYLDLQTIIDRNAFANSEDTQFMSTFLDNNNAIVPLKIGIGAALWLRPTSWIELIAGVADADNEILQTGVDTAFDDFDSLLVYGEAGLRAQLPSARGTLTGNYRFGTFYDPRSRPKFGRADPVTGDPRLERGDMGFYLSFDQLVFRESPEDEQGLGLFVRYGYRDEDTNRIEHFWSGGLQYRGALPGRESDALGVAIYQAILSDDLRDRVHRDFSRETGLEVNYRIQLTPGIAVSPGFQFIDNPGGVDSARDAQVFVIRSRVAF